MPLMLSPHEIKSDDKLARLIDALAPRFDTPKAELVMEIEARLTELLGVEVGEAFRRVASRQQHTATSLNLDRAHKSALVLLAHVLQETANREKVNCASTEDKVGVT